MTDIHISENLVCISGGHIECTRLLSFHGYLWPCASLVAARGTTDTLHEQPTFIGRGASTAWSRRTPCGVRVRVTLTPGLSSTLVGPSTQVVFAFDDVHDVEVNPDAIPEAVLVKPRCHWYEALWNLPRPSPEEQEAPLSLAERLRSAPHGAKSC